MRKDIIFIKKENDEILQYNVEIPVTWHEFSEGLANRNLIPEFTGMLYEYVDEYPEKVGMHTPDTIIPVDFIFIDNAGTIIKIYNNAKPLCSDVISSYFTKWVLEINGGECKKHNIQIGDRIQWEKDGFKDELEKKSTHARSYQKICNDIYCLENNQITHSYSYRSHKWLHVDEYTRAKIQKRLTHTTKITHLKEIDEKFALLETQKINKEFIEDYKKTQHRYFWANKNLFLRLNLESSQLDYYNFKKGWTEYKWNFNYDTTEQLFWNSFAILSKEAEEKIIETSKKITPKEQTQLNKGIIEQLEDLLTLDYYRSIFLYKPKSNTCWKVIDIYGNKKEATKIAKENIKKGNWLEYKFLRRIRFDEKKLAKQTININHADILDDNNDLISLPKSKNFYTQKQLTHIPINGKTKKIKNFNLEIKRNKKQPNFKELIVKDNDSIIGKTLFDDYELWKKLQKIKKDFIAKNAIITNNEYFNRFCIFKTQDNKTRFISVSFSSRKNTDYDLIIDTEEFITEIEKAIEKLS